MAVTDKWSRYRWVALGIASLCQCGASLCGQALAPLAPLFQPDLGLSKAEVGLFASAVSAGTWSVTFIAGSATDRFGIRTLISLGQVTAGLFLMLMPFTGSMLQAAAVMLLVGMARGTVFPGATKAILEWFPPASRATAMGIKQTGAPVGGILAASTLPAVGLVFGWRFAIAVAGLAVVASGVASGLLYRDSPLSSRVAGGGVGMRASLGAVLRNKSIWMVGSMAFLYAVVQQALVIYVALYFKDRVLVSLVPDESARVVAAGGFLAVCQAGGVFGRVFWGVVSDRLLGGRRLATLMVIGVVSTLACLTVGSLGAGSAPWFLTVVVFVAGAGAIGWNGVFHTMITETVGRKYAATGVGLGLTMVEFGVFVGPPLFGYVADVGGTYQVAWILLACLSAVGVLVAALTARCRILAA